MARAITRLNFYRNGISDLTSEPKTDNGLLGSDEPEALRESLEQGRFADGYRTVLFWVAEPAVPDPGCIELDAPSPVITTQCLGIGNGRFGHPEQDRAISIREAALLQTFPKGFRFVAPEEPVIGLWLARQIGNAVPVKLSRVIARAIKKTPRRRFKSDRLLATRAKTASATPLTSFKTSCSHTRITLQPRCLKTFTWRASRRIFRWIFSIQNSLDLPRKLARSARAPPPRPYVHAKIAVDENGESDSSNDEIRGTTEDRLLDSKLRAAAPAAPPLGQSSHLVPRARTARIRADIEAEGT